MPRPDEESPLRNRSFLVGVVSFAAGVMLFIAGFLILHKFRDTVYACDQVNAAAVAAAIGQPVSAGHETENVVPMSSSGCSFSTASPAVTDELTVWIEADGELHRQFDWYRSHGTRAVGEPATYTLGLDAEPRTEGAAAITRAGRVVLTVVEGHDGAAARLAQWVVTHING